MIDVNSQFALSLIILLLGYALKRSQVVTEADGKVLAAIIFYITLPATILTSLDSLELDVMMLAMPLFSLGYSAVMYLVAWFSFSKEDESSRGLMTVSCLGFNIGNFAFPLMRGIYGDEGMGYTAMFDFGNVFVIFVLNYVLSIRHSPKEGIEMDAKAIFKKVFSAPAIYCYILSIVLNASDFQFTGFTASVLETISRANHLIVYLTLGIFLNISLDSTRWKRILKVLALRYGIGIMTGILLHVFLPWNILPRTILLIAFILPIGMANVVYMITYGYDEKLGGTLINLTNLVSFFLMWILLLLFS